MSFRYKRNVLSFEKKYRMKKIRINGPNTSSSFGNGTNSMNVHMPASGTIEKPLEVFPEFRGYAGNTNTNEPIQGVGGATGTPTVKLGGDASFSCMMLLDNGSTMIGFSYLITLPTNWKRGDYIVHLSNGSMILYNRVQGASPLNLGVFGTYTVGDKIAVVSEGTTMKLYKNDVFVADFPQPINGVLSPWYYAFNSTKVADSLLLTGCLDV